MIGSDGLNAMAWVCDVAFSQRSIVDLTGRRFSGTYAEIGMGGLRVIFLLSSRSVGWDSWMMGNRKTFVALDEEHRRQSGGPTGRILESCRGR